ncbi:MAG: Hsp33 family molecular chaperone HslO [Gammaproteobacteria bacterium]|nr:Hsp33 family molecular chaperone HslO [Gammaproteobacteria bacterium]
MTKQDCLHRFIFENLPIRGEVIELHETVQTILNQHPYPPAIRQLLGEALCVAGLLSAIIKFNGRLTVQFRGQGKLKLLIAQCDNDFHLRGLVKYSDDLSHDDLMKSFDQGVLVILLDSDANNSHYQGIVSWRGNSLVESIEGYFKDSEQLATKIWLAVNETQAAGLLLQIIPDKTKDSTIENEILMPHWEQMIKQTAHLTSHDLLTMDHQDLLRKLYPEEEIRVFPSVPISFQCTCSRKRGADAILLLGREEAEAELNEKQVIVVTCDFCKSEYIFDRVDIQKLFIDRDNYPPSQTQLH